MSTITVVIACSDTKLGLAMGGTPPGNDSRVLVAVVKVGPVRMRVYELFVAMPVGVVGGGREIRVCVEVMPVVVPVGVHVLDRLVHVDVLVLAQEECGDGGGEQDGSRHVLPGERLAEQAEGERRADERCAREEGLGPRSPDLVGRADVECDAGAVGEAAHDEGGGDGSQRGAQGIGENADGKVGRAGHGAFD